MASRNKYTHKRVFNGPAFQKLAELFAANDILELCRRRRLIARVSPVYSSWLAITAIKSGYASGLKMLRSEIWDDPAFCKDAYNYATIVGNHRALKFIAEMTAARA